MSSRLPSRRVQRSVMARAVTHAISQTVANILARSMLAVTATTFSAMVLPGAYAQQVEAAKDYRIPADTLTTVLNRFGRDAGILLSFSTDQTNGLQSKGISGRYTVPAALRELLQGSGLEATPQAGDAYVIRSQLNPATARNPVNVPASDMSTGTSLPTIVISAQQPRLFETPDVNAGALGVRGMQDLPFSIGSYTTDTIESQRARTALDVLRNDPSVSPVTYGASFDGVAVRGFSANTFNNVRRDGLLANVYADVPLENKDRIDVLKGVSGFLYGVGDPSGLVNYVIKRPTRDRLLSLTGEIRSQSGYYANVDAGGPLNDGQLGYRLNAAKEKVGDFTHPGDLDREFVSGALDVKLNRDSMLQLDFDYQQKSQSASASLGPRLDGTLVPASSVDPRTLIGQPWARYKSRSWNAGARLDYALNADWTLTSQLGYGSTFRNALFNNVNTVALNGNVLSGGVSYEGEEYRVISGQVFATGKLALAGFKHELVGGYSYSKMDYPEGPYTRLPDQIANIYHPVSRPDPHLPSDTGLPTAHSIQHSLFVSDTIALSEAWSVLLGARYIDYVNDKPRDYPDSGVRLHYATATTVPTVSILFKPLSHTTAYITYTKGFEQGAYAPNWANNAYERLDPITSRQYEIGLKSSIIQGMQLSAALFDIDKPLQSVSSVDNVFKTKGRQQHRGVELAANGQITRQLSGIFGLAWLDAKQHDTGDVSVDGKRPANVARFQSSMFLDYRFDETPGLSLNAAYYHMGNRPLNGANSIMVDSFTRWDLGATYTTRLFDKPSVVRLTVQNVANKRYWESVVYGTVGMAQPRTVRLSLTSQF
ncbi:TonB-dependent receptor [Undibacterium sp. CY18W]|uniref:TonB-dependent receptor n=1 Tax=Undibacterium hunanense TaxID=2762292 RepID=A0ABR6ZRN4_9BURK|nr:TonB-dependent receptor [Undibacterium hunanense]MBC3918474.1 TonB-dependent receptor [Undibacterium hunanense]